MLSVGIQFSGFSISFYRVSLTIIATLFVLGVLYACISSFASGSDERMFDLKTATQISKVLRQFGIGNFADY